MSQTNATVHAVDANNPSMSIHYEPFVVGMGVNVSDQRHCPCG
jgi:hypothetical protein